MTTQTSRRKFLKTGCLTALAVGVTVCGGGAVIANIKPKIDLPELTANPAANQKRVLITYATRAGSTAETAARMGDVLAKKNLAVDVLPVGKVTDIAPYEAIVVGSAIRMGRVLPEIKTFVETNQSALKQKTFAMFILCVTASKTDEASRKEVITYLDPVRTILKPNSEGIFAGVMNPDALSLLDRTITINMMNTPVGDFRDWDQINTWTENLV